MGEVRTENADLLKRIGDNQAQELSEKEAKLNQVKLEKVTLEAITACKRVVPPAFFNF